MQLLLIRHADAGQRDPARWPDDRLRPLSDEGRKVQARVARALGDLGVAPGTIYTSPWARAAESAEILARELGLRRPAVEAPALAAEPDLARLAREVGRHGEAETVALVGHSPWMEELAALLLSGDPAGLALDFPKSGVLGLAAGRLAPKAATLRFFLRPTML